MSGWFWFREIFLISLVIGATVYNIMQDQRIDKLEEEVNELRKERKAHAAGVHRRRVRGGGHGDIRHGAGIGRREGRFS